MNDNKYLIGDIRIDGVKYSAEFLDFAEREKQGLVTEGEKQKLLSEQHHLVDEVAKHKEEVSILQGEKSTLQNDIKQERKNFTDMQTKFKPRKDDLQRVLKLAKETKPPPCTKQQG
ncbi:MAG: hypothetical protein FWE29_05475 [Defluviitaleaceae bacterium]|nr:hypothetical protein [Defluviitaleaceae bacterium]